MENIDWSKAPEGATHYNLMCGDWYKVSGDSADVWSNFRGCWFPAQAWKSRKDYCVARPSPSWSGQGLPPVGVVCEAGIPHTSGPNDESRSIVWIEGRVIAYHEIKGRQYAWFAEADEGFYPPGVFEFRPIRTPEQIATDEREAQVVAIHDAIVTSVKVTLGQCDSWRKVAEMVFDAGFKR